MFEPMRTAPVQSPIRALHGLTATCQSMDEQDCFMPFVRFFQKVFYLRLLSPGPSMGVAVQSHIAFLLPCDEVDAVTVSSL